MTQAFDLIETTIDDVHDAMEAGEITSQELVERYLDRIDRYDRNGPELNSIITVNKAASDRAAELDELQEREGFVGPLHGIPVLVKDQAETEGLRTTFGSEACTDYVPKSDATIVSQLKEAGAIVLAKTNLPDFAAAYFGRSSELGQTKNPYDTSRDPGGSSAGTGSSVAANLGVVGVGEDTGGSIRVPSANCNLFGIRVTTGLISRTGLSPIVTRQDTAGPMARTVTDMARLLDVLVGYDLEDEWTSINAYTNVDSYTDYLDEDGLEGKRIGVLRERFGSDDNPDAAPVNALVEERLEQFREAGAELVDPVSIADVEEQIQDTEVYEYYATIHLNAFLEERDDIPYDSVREICDAGAYHESLVLLEAIAEMNVVPEEELDFWRQSLGQESFRRDIMNTFATNDLDAILFPDVQVVPPKIAELGDKYTTANYPTNTPIGAQSQCPAISVPAGITDEGCPVGIELLGKPHHEEQLIEMAYAYEQIADPRQPPESAPALE
jgi:Asp-tRNA(Asn)/Glu-tRNA(Gln) amidotransferase A subunit family amidase